MPSKEASLLRKYFDKLVGAISNPIPLADALYAREIIDKSTQLDAAIQSKNVRDRSSKLLSDVERVLESEPGKFETVLSIFRENLTTETLLDEIEEKYYEIKDSKRNDENEVRQRKKQHKMEPKDESGVDDTNDNSNFSYWPAVKGVGTVMLVSLVIWIICMVGYSFLAFNTYNEENPTISKSPEYTSYSPSGSCHHINLSTAYEELHTEIADAKIFGIHLGLPKVKMDIIERENRSEKERLLEVLHTCNDLNLCLCWEHITQALVKYGNVRKAKEMEAKYIAIENKD